MDSAPCVRFEEVREEHIPELLGIYTYYVLHTTATFHAHSPTPDEMRAIVLFEDPRYRAFVILEDGRLCGYVLVHRYKVREAYDGTAEVGVYLRPDCVGRGLGGLAVRHIGEYARKQGFHMLIAVICGENEHSIRLFERCGYEKCGHIREAGRKFGRLLDIVLYQKILG